jgi:hypothetical protein
MKMIFHGIFDSVDLEKLQKRGNHSSRVTVLEITKGKEQHHHQHNNFIHREVIDSR